MAKRKNGEIDLNTILIIGIIGVLLYGGSQGWFQFNPDIDITTPTGSVTFDSIQTTEIDCKISLDKSSYCSGDPVEANLRGPENELFYIGINKDDEGWTLWGEKTTNFNGLITETGYVHETGNYKIRAISDSCVTNLVQVSVTACGDSEPECWWQSVAKEDMDIPADIILNWGTTLVEGKFKYEWHYSRAGIDTEILKGSSVIHSSSSQSGNHQIETSGGYHELKAYNDLLQTANADLELFQWVCEGDPMNWNPEMIGSMSTGAHADCETECSDLGYSYGYQPEVDCQEYEEYNIELDCCCGIWD
jgi:hypothetical protein